MSNQQTNGRIEYGERAFHQDVMEAMGGNIVRGIIELITNSDDAYAAQGSSSRQKKIKVEVEHRRSQPWKVVVRDRATGMRANSLVKKITMLGGRSSGFERGEDRRGNLGRGAKDLAAFGDVVFASVAGGNYSELVLRRTGDWELTADRKAENVDREDLGIPRGNGTVVTVEATGLVRCPRHDTLLRTLSCHYQLRDILSDTGRRVELTNLNDGKVDLLSYQYPDLPVVYEGNLEINGYPEANAHLVIWRHNTRYDDTPQDPCRSTGILIKGNRAIYDNTLFKFDGEIHAGWFSGKLVCPYIDRLAREYDDRLEASELQESANPMPIISRRRDGLVISHPFVQALKTEVEKPLQVLIAAEAEKAQGEGKQIISDETKADLDRLAKEVSRLIREELKDIDALDFLGEGEGEAPPLAIRPEMMYVYIGEPKTLSVAARVDTASIGDEIEVTMEPEGVVDVLKPVVSLTNARRREDILVAQVRITPLLENESTLLTVTHNGHSAVALIEVLPEREVIVEEIEPPEAFQFERPGYRIGWQRGKNLNLVAPADLAAEYGYSVKVSSSDPGVVIRTPAVTLEYDDSVEFYRAPVRIEGRGLDATSNITARLEDLVATAQVKVTRKEEGLSFKIELTREPMGFWRAIIEKKTLERGNDVNVIRVAVDHPAIRPYLGDSNEGENSPAFRAVLAEIVADVSARHVVSQLYRSRHTTEEFDAERIYREHYRRTRRFLPRFIRILVGDPRSNQFAMSLTPLDLKEAS